MLLYKGKNKGLTRKEIMLAWFYGRRIEPLEPCDFSKN